MWKTDGTEQGTVLVKDLNPGPEGSRIAGSAVLGNSVYFVTLFDNGLWKSDGTEAGTVRLASNATGGGVAAAGGLVYFVGSDPATGDELWKTDGTVAGTALVKDVRPGPESSLVYNFAASGGQLYFVARDTDDRVFDLFRTDGTPGGTSLVMEHVSYLSAPDPRVGPLADTAFFIPGDPPPSGNTPTAAPTPCGRPTPRPRAARSRSRTSASSPTAPTAASCPGTAAASCSSRPTLSPARTACGRATARKPAQ